jgi:hypothetical protein
MSDNQGRREHDQDFRRRVDDQIIPRIDQKLDDLLVRFDEHLRWADLNSEKVNDRLTLLERVKESVEQPAKWIGWTVVITVGGALAYFGQKMAAFMEHHIH